MSTTLTTAQQFIIARARAFIAASNQGAAALAAEVEAQTGRAPRNAGDPYPEAFGVAHIRIEDLLDIIDGLTGGAS